MLQLKSSLVGTYEWVSPMDPALDLDEAARLSAVREYRGDLPVKAGQQPTIFVLTHLSGRSYVAAQDVLVACKTSPAVLACRIVELALTSVRNLLDEHGAPFVLQRSTHADGIVRADPEQVAALYRSEPDCLSLLALHIVNKERPPTP